MCDVLLAMQDATQNGSIIFGKNSDRPDGECQVLFYNPGGDEPEDEPIHCSYVDIPQIKQTLATLGTRPYWCWGYEIGINEAGVAAGNVAIFTRALSERQNQKIPGLTGMDLVRLGLERGCTAEEAMNVIISFLERYGQWGSGVQGQDHHKGSYDNGFLISDRKEAWILETSDRRWVARRILSGVTSISNQLSIRTDIDRSSPDLFDFAAEKGWWHPKTGPFDFALAYSDHEHYPRQVSHIRWMRSQQLLEQNKGHIDVASMMTFLRDHYEDTFLQGAMFNQYLPDFMTICMHDSPSHFTWGNTAASAIIEIDPEGLVAPAFWLCYQPPCSSIYACFCLGDSIPDIVTNPGEAGLNIQSPVKAPVDRFCYSSIWWRLHRLLEATQKNPLKRYPELRDIFDPLERKNLELHSKKHKNSLSINRSGKHSIIIEKEVTWIMEAIEVLEKKWKID